ncbi:MAG: aminoglycoside phosphotransferase family protein [Clostridia bacterium]|nr:aminoglycoside phosphotransferase family protein [Clostridia bacterium]
MNRESRNFKPMFKAQVVLELLHEEKTLNELEGKYMAERLVGGRENIMRDLERVYRPSHEGSICVHDFLRYLHSCGFNSVPFPFGINEIGQEEVSFVEGTVFNGALSQDARSDETLIAFAQYIRRFHDFGAEYIEHLSGDEKWMLPVQTKIETMCHGDLAPYNTVLSGQSIVGLIDFDTLHPGSRLWDLSYALYRWIPLMSDDNPGNFGSRSDKSRRIELFLDAYGTDVVSREDVFKWVIRRVEYLVVFMSQEAADGDETFKQHIEDGHLKGYLDDLIYIRKTWANQKIVKSGTVLPEKLEMIRK